jgi:truncated hemoglobin YjbI
VVKKKRERDPNLDHPAVRMHREIVRLGTNHIQRRDIIAHISAAVQEMGLDADRALLMWRASLENYMLTGKNPRNVGYMLDLYDERLRGPKWDRHNRR